MAIKETCPCGASFQAAGPTADLDHGHFLKAHEVCRERMADARAELMLQRETPSDETNGGS